MGGAVWSRGPRARAARARAAKAKVARARATRPWAVRWDGGSEVNGRATSNSDRRKRSLRGRRGKEKSVRRWPWLAIPKD